MMMEDFLDTAEDYIIDDQAEEIKNAMNNIIEYDSSDIDIVAGIDDEDDEDEYDENEDDDLDYYEFDDLDNIEDYDEDDEDEYDEDDNDYIDYHISDN